MLMRQPNPEQLRTLNQVNILSPVEGNTYSLQNDIKISLTIPSNIVLTKVDYFIDNNKITSSTVSPFELAFNPEESQISKGKHEFKAVIYDQLNNSITKTISFTLGQ